jgi:hypothetical protein
MKFKDWLNYELPISDTIHSATGQNILKIFDLPLTGDPPVSHPIGVAGMQSGFLLSGGITKILKENKNNINTKLCYTNSRPVCSKGTQRRKKILKNIMSHDFLTMSGYQASPPKKLNSIVYFTEMSEHKFCASPEGNGEDCWRHYETILTKGIPIIQEPNNDFCLKRWKLPSQIKRKYEDLPVVYTNDYSDLTKEYLYEKYEEILETDYNFDKMKISYWEDSSLILYCMNAYTNAWRGESELKLTIRKSASA